VHRPGTREQVQEATEAFLTHYNDERPNQARSCGNQPPRVACSQFPTLPAVPEKVHPDRWLRRVHQQTFARTVQADGAVSIDRREYYVGRALAGQRVGCRVQAASQHFDVWSGASRIKQLPIKGLHGGPALPTERVCHADEAGSAFGVSALFADPCQLEARPPVGLSAGEEALPQNTLPRHEGFS